MLPSTPSTEPDPPPSSPAVRHRSNRRRSSGAVNGVCPPILLSRLASSPPSLHLDNGNDNIIMIMLTLFYGLWVHTSSLTMYSVQQYCMYCRCIVGISVPLCDCVAWCAVRRACARGCVTSAVMQRQQFAKPFASWRASTEPTVCAGAARARKHRGGSHSIV